MKKPHFVVIKSSSGDGQKFPLKQWLRKNTQEIPSKMDPDVDTSHQLRRGLKRNGWILQILENEILVVQPDESGNFSYADDLLEFEIDEEEEKSGSQEYEESSEITFGLERDLQLALRSDITQLNNGFEIIDNGIERNTRAGRIDITASDSEGRVVVVELKVGRPNSSVVAQVLSYMAAIKEEENKLVRGLVVAGDFSDRVVLAAQAVPNLDLYKYSFQFSFTKV